MSTERWRIEEMEGNGAITEALPALVVIAGEVEGFRSRLGAGLDPLTTRDGLDRIVQGLETVIEELQVSNEELRLTVMALQFERSRYWELFHCGPDARLLTEPDGTITDANAAAGTLLGLSAQDLTGRAISGLVAEGGAADAGFHLGRAARGQRGAGVWTLRRQDGQNMVADVTYVPLSSDGAVTSVQWVLMSLEQPMFESEDRDDPNPELARRWLNVYGELTAATEALIDEASDRAGHLGRIARSEFEDAHHHDLDARLTRARQGLAFWRRRHASLVDLEFDLAHGLVTHRERTVRFTRRELQLLNLLLGHPGQWFRASALMVQAWHSSYLAEEQLRTYVVRLRKKLARLDAPCRIVNQRGRGYALEFGEPSADMVGLGVEEHGAESIEPA